MSFVQVVSYKKLPNGRKEYTEEVYASTPDAAKTVIEGKQGCEILVTKNLTTIPSSDANSGPSF